MVLKLTVVVLLVIGLPFRYYVIRFTEYFYFGSVFVQP